MSFIGSAEHCSSAALRISRLSRSRALLTIFDSAQGRIDTPKCKIETDPELSRRQTVRATLAPTVQTFSHVRQKESEPRTTVAEMMVGLAVVALLAAIFFGPRL